MKQALYKFLLLFMVPITVAIAKQAPGLGSVAQNILEPVGIVSDFLHTACIVIGASFLFASIIKYIEHRRSPLMVPISTVVFLLIAGLALVLFPFLGKLTQGGVPYSLMK